MNPSTRRIPVIDVFAGPGGLSEGFWRTGHYDIRLSIEKDVCAHDTLKLRAFFHEFPVGEAPPDYYQLLAGEITAANLYGNHPAEATAADSRAWLAELGAPSCPDWLVDDRIAAAVGSAQDQPWVLIGGPPCQAYSVVGRARRRSDPDFEKDPRHTLYKQYLRIIAKHRPAAFVMENVPGILTSKLGGQQIFPDICSDLQNPGRAIGGAASSQYRLYSLRPDASDGTSVSPWDYVLNAEDYGVPQARHRVVLVGVRTDVSARPGQLEAVAARTTVRDAICDLPKLRSRLSREEDSPQAWLACLEAMTREDWFGEIRDPKLIKKLSAAIRSLNPFLPTAGGKLQRATVSSELATWFSDSRVCEPPNHESRGHMRTDLWRYLYASTFAEVFHRSPNIQDFPRGLWPKHANLSRTVGDVIFGDRFHVQTYDGPSSTVVAHISKDGHYYIHPDPSQCRSLTVREAARLQTFSDDYMFLGPRTQQFHQVGNAVPPMLAAKIADAVCVIFDDIHG